MVYVSLFIKVGLFGGDGDGHRRGVAGRVRYLLV